jgi:hypothetical protein
MPPRTSYSHLAPLWMHMLVVAQAVRMAHAAMLTDSVEAHAVQACT